MRILIISFECWRDDTNGGNVLSNLFADMPDAELAQIYCKGGLPQNRVCKRYYRMNDRMALQALLHRSRPMGEVLRYETWPDAAAQGGGEKRFYDFFRRHDWAIFQAGRELLWALAPWKNAQLAQFVKDFAPDIIFAPCYGNLFMQRLDRWVFSQTGAPAVSYISDDNYSLRQLRFSPVYWGHRLLLRASIRRTAKHWSWMYTMTRQQAQELGAQLHIEMRILRKGAVSFPGRRPPVPGAPVRLLYAGGTYLGRDAILVKVARALRRLNAEGRACRLDIYTNSAIPAKWQAELNDGAVSTVHAAVPMEALKRRYVESDIALHVEAFQKKEALLTRLSFSTKIVDCLASGCAVLAICPPINAGWQYLRDENAALCVGAEAEIGDAVRRLVCGADLRQQLRRQGEACLKRNHDPERIRQELRDALAKTIRGAV